MKNKRSIIISVAALALIAITIQRNSVDIRVYTSNIYAKNNGTAFAQHQLRSEGEGEVDEEAADADAAIENDTANAAVHSKHPSSLHTINFAEPFVNRWQRRFSSSESRWA